MAVTVYNSLDFSNMLIDIIKSGIDITFGFNYLSSSSLFVKNINSSLNMHDSISNVWHNDNFTPLRILDTSILYAKNNIFTSIADPHIELLDPKSKLTLRIYPKK